jgi:hypothetical protein
LTDDYEDLIRTLVVLPAIVALLVGATVRADSGPVVIANAGVLWSW